MKRAGYAALAAAIAVCALPGRGQDAPAQQPAAEAKPAEAQVPATETPPSAAREEQITGSVDFGYRWVLGKGGSEDVYRSIVNLGEGPKLFGADASIRRPGGRFYDRVDVHATSWGGDPYNTARLDAARAGCYNFRFDYRNVAYFNSLPSFANPFVDAGALFSQRSFDTTRRLIDTELEMRPGARFSPYLAYYHSSGFGRGVTTFVADGSEFPVATQLRDATDSYRGGLRINFRKLNLTLEEGGTTFKDDQQIGFAGSNPGNRRVPLLGQNLLLRDLRQAYGARGHGTFSRAVVEARPWSKLSVTGQFLYSEPSIDVNYFQQNSGSFILLQTLQAFTGQLDRSIADANRPRSSGSWAIEFRPVPRFRIVDSWFTDRFHISSASLLSEVFTASTGNFTSSASAADRLVLNYNQHQVDVIADVASFLTLRGGHRYEWGDAAVPITDISPTPGPDRGELRRQVALAGGVVRVRSNFDVNVDLEAAASDRTYFRTDLADYQRARVRGRYRLSKALTWTGTFAILNNRNDGRGIGLDFQSRQSGMALILTPGGAQRWSVLLDYTRATVRSSIPYLAPQDRTPEISRYRDDGHFGGASLDVVLWRRARITVGGSFAVDRGSRPTRYLEPRGRAVIPLWKLLSWTAEWRWFGFDETRFGFENFHAHLFSTGLRIAR